ncbi:L,D-transpeptidase family protein [Schaalia odontolytica]|uniref:L,D-transpeptidase family protein n=1 Tax=Schaalia odontolytica TaxID=1660 RepID=UPI00211B90AF|nr:L,D-transpeptidase family protein [Schaalia odontolytica]UUO93486.1 L,D-transpeptidase/peptidoglycan binding protein [Schaalia odontolytica]
MLKNISLKAKWAIGLACAVALLLVCAVVVYLANYSGRVLPGTSIAGTSVAGMTRDQVVASTSQRADAATVTITVEGTETTASLNEAGISIDADATADAAMKGATSLPAFVRSLFSGRGVEPVMTVDEDAIRKLAATASSTLSSETRDAQVVVADDGESFTVTPSQSGDGISADEVSAAVKQAGATLASVSRDASVQKTEPAITTENARAAAAKANALLDTTIEISDGIDTFSAERSDKVKWVEFLTKDDGSLDDPSIDPVKVADWVNALAAKTDVKPENRVDNVNSEGQVLTVAREGKKGLKTNNAEQITKDVVAAMTSRTAYEGLFHYDDVEPGSETKQVAEGTENLVYQAAEGEKWVDIDLSDDSVTAYVGGKVAGGPFYMVPGAPDTPTVTGTFHVYLKYDVQTMRGENADGSKYVTEGVPWVTYFTGSYAMHGAPWRSSFGWSGYGGSHGCVNMPVDAAKFIYDWTDMGDTVVVHY